MGDNQMPLSEELTQPPPPGAIEEETYSRGFKCIAGLDEVGRGPLAGPVVAAAVVLPRGFSHPDIKDSKLLSPSQRETVGAHYQTKCGDLGTRHSRGRRNRPHQYPQGKPARYGQGVKGFAANSRLSPHRW